MNQMIVEARLKTGARSAGPVSWLISRLASREMQERVIGFWNEYGELPADVSLMPRHSPGVASAWRREAL